MDHWEDRRFDSAERAYLEPPDLPYETPPKRMSGYSGVGRNDGMFVPEEKALAYALERCGLKLSDRVRFESEWGADGKDFVEWFYSGCWVREGA